AAITAGMRSRPGGREGGTAIGSMYAGETVRFYPALPGASSPADACASGGARLHCRTGDPTLPSPDPENRPEVTVGIPAYNEKECLEAVVRNGRDGLPRRAVSYEILVIDDGSTDGTSALADDLAARWPEVRVVHHPENRSFSGAIRSLHLNSWGRWLFLCPADRPVVVREIK